MAVGSHFEQRRAALQLQDEGVAVADIAAVMRDRYGLVGLVAVRQARGWTQQQAADEWCRRWPGDRIEQGTLSGWERWPSGGRMPKLSTLERLAELYAVSASDLVAGWADFRRDGVLGRSADRYGCGVDRRAFIGVVAGAGLASALPKVPTRVGVGEVEQLRAAVDALYLADDRAGGAVVYGRVVEQLTHVRTVLDRATYTDAVGGQLQGVAGRLTEMAGRCAFDAGHKAEGRRLLHEALVIARVAEDDELAVSAFAWLSRDASAQGAGRQAVEFSRAAARTAGRSATPLLRSVLSLREALGHALEGDPVACTVALSCSEDALTDEDGGGEPAWLGFMGPAVFHGGAAEAFLYLRQPNAAERAARAALQANDATAFPRNRGLYLGRLADALVTRGAIDEGAAVTVEALGGVRSGRMVDQLRGLAPALERYETVRGVPEALAALAEV